MKCECGREYEGRFCPSCGKPSPQQLGISQEMAKQTPEEVMMQNQQQVSGNQYAGQQTMGYQQVNPEMNTNQTTYNQNYYGMGNQGMPNQNGYNEVNNQGYYNNTEALSQNNYNGMNTTYNNGMYPKQEEGSVKGFSIASMVCGIVALCCSCCFYYVSFPTAIVAVVFAYLAIKKKGAAGSNRGMAIAGMVCGIVALIPAMCVLIFGASLLDEI